MNKHLKEFKKYKILDLEISNLTHNEVLSYFKDKIEAKEKVFCVTLNVDILRIANLNKEYLKVIKASNLIFADGMPLVWLSRLKNQPLKERIAGRKIVYDLCKLSNDNGYKVFMLGAAPGVADCAKAKLEKQMPNIQITGTYSPTKEELCDPESNMKIVEMINNSGADILFVALGAPKQEMWIHKNLSNLKPYIYIPCGGSIDFIAGVQKKCPELIGNIGFEWLFRLSTNPGRLFKRYIIDDLPFLFGLTFADTQKQTANAGNALINILNVLRNIEKRKSTEFEETVRK